MTTVKIRKIGNSQGVVLPKEILGAANAKLGDDVTVTVTAEGVIQLSTYDPGITEQVEKARDLARRYKNALRELAK
jgi:putative addiction module antidote